mgnify:CR=1 FL=1
MKPLANARTKIGKSAAILSASYIVLMTLKLTIRLPLPSPVIALLALAGLVCAILALVRKDRGFWIWFALLQGLLVLTWVIAEFLFPH